MLHITSCTWMRGTFLHLLQLPSVYLNPINGYRQETYICRPHDLTTYHMTLHDLTRDNANYVTFQLQYLLNFHPQNLKNVISQFIIHPCEGMVMILRLRGWRWTRQWPGNSRGRGGSCLSNVDKI